MGLQDTKNINWLKGKKKTILLSEPGSRQCGADLGWALLDLEVLTVLLEPHLSFSTTSLRGMKRTSTNFTFIDCSEHMILEEEQVPPMPADCQE